MRQAFINPGISFLFLFMERRKKPGKKGEHVILTTPLDLGVLLWLQGTLPCCYNLNP